MTIWRSTPVCIVIHQEGDSPIFGDTVTKVCLDVLEADESGAGGYYISLSQQGSRAVMHGIQVEEEELDAIVEAARHLLSKARKDQEYV